MKWNMIIGALVLSLGLCGHSFAGGLLDKVLGGGCDACDCEAAPSCGCEEEPTCGCDSGCTGCDISCGLLSALCNLKLPALPSLHGCGCDSCGDCDSGCADSGSDGDDLEEAPEASDAAPMPPAPIVDPSAFVPSKKRHVILTSVIR